MLRYPRKSPVLCVMLSLSSLSLPQPSVIKQAGKVSASPPEVEPALFYQPGKAGFYSLVQATPTPERLQAFRGVGRMIGLGLLLSEVFPVPLCRHVLKFIMMREVHYTLFSLRQSFLA